MALQALDFHGRVRLINYIRKNVSSVCYGPFWYLSSEQKPTSNELADLQGTEPWFSTDQYLLPALENDPLIREVIIVYTLRSLLTALEFRDIFR